MKPLIRILIIAVIFLAGLMVGLSFRKTPAMAPTTEEEIGNGLAVTLTLDYGDNNSQTYQDVEINPGQSVFYLLEKVTTANNIELGYKNYGSDLGALVESINNLKNDFDKDIYWHYWVNGDYAKIGASNYILSDQDIVRWEYTNNQYNN